MKLLIIFLVSFLFINNLNAKEYRIDLNPKGFKKFSKRGWGKKTIYENLSDAKGYFIKATADASATNVGIKIENPDLIKKYMVFQTFVAKNI